MRITQSNNEFKEESFIGANIMVLNEAVIYKDYRNKAPYDVLGIWALKGIVIGQAKKTGPKISLCIINLTHAWNTGICWLN